MRRRCLVLTLLALAACAAPSTSDETEAIAQDQAIVGALPACASPLMREVYERAKSVVERGPIPEQVFATGRNRVDPRVLVEGPEIFPKMAELIEHAEREVMFQTFVWEADSFAAKTLMAGLGRLQARIVAEGGRGDRPPVVVRFVIDASELGVPSAKTSDVMPRVARGLEEQNLDPNIVRWEIATFEHTTVGNQHSKTLVVDGREAIVTGANPELVHDPGEPWHDSGYHVTGDAALALMGDFDYAWNRGVAWSCGSSRGEDCEHPTQRFSHAPLGADLPEDTCSPVLVIGRKRNANPFNNRTDNTQDQAFLAAFAGAKRKIRVETPNLNDDKAKSALLDAVERGVTVEVVLGKKFNEGGESVPGQGGGNEKNVAALYDALAKRGVKDACERLVIRWYSFDGIAPVVGNGPRASHTKYATIDGAIAIVGSTNMDTQSWNNAHEVDLVIDDARVVSAWDAQLFEPDFARGVVVEQCSLTH